jgi:hypothetical protein
MAWKRREIFQDKKLVLDTVRSIAYVWVYPEIEILPVSARPLEREGIAEIQWTVAATVMVKHRWSSYADFNGLLVF